jgi:hypothetical protein
MGCDGGILQDEILGAGGCSVVDGNEQPHGGTLYFALELELAVLDDGSVNGHNSEESLHIAKENGVTVDGAVGSAVDGVALGGLLAAGGEGCGYTAAKPAYEE